MAERIANKPIGARIRELREKKGWSLSELAKRAQISRSYVYQIEQGESEPTREKIQKLAEAFGALPSELLGEKSQVEIPDSLREFARQEKLGSKDIQMLAQIEYRGHRPNTPEEWKAIYSVIKGMLQK